VALVRIESIRLSSGAGGPSLAQIDQVVTRHRRSIAIVIGVMAAVLALLPRGREQPPPAAAQPRPAREWPLEPSHANEHRELALRHARVWRPSTPAATDMAANPPDPAGTLSGEVVRCRFLSRPAHGTTPKFDCVLADGEVVKVKYGHTGEIHAELAATRLLTALGFGSDRMFLVPRVRCYGCTQFPFYVTWLLDRLHARTLATRYIAQDRYTDFEWVSIERRFEGTEIAGGREKGWAWYELDKIDPAAGASRAEVDAFRLIAMLLAHWDNKAANQRLVCLASPGPNPGPYPRPFALINDLGASFGPNKVDLDHWQKSAIWTDASRCTISMRKLPYNGGTFPDVQVTEGGRQLIARQLAALTESQLVSLFLGARFREFHRDDGPEGDVHAWAAAFQKKVREISTGGPCPSESRPGAHDQL
jgi:hypothetical protein